MSISFALHYKFFKDSEMNYFYWSIFIMSFGEYLINIFVPIYFYNLGFSITKIIFFYLLVSFFFIILSYHGAKIVSRFGVKHSLLLSVPFLIAYYCGLSFVEFFPGLFFLLPFLLASRMVLFNYSYHLNFIAHSNKRRRGYELAFFGIAATIVTAVAPFFGGLLSSVSFPVLFATSALIMFFGSVPLFLSRDLHETLRFNPLSIIKKLFSRRFRGNFLSFSGYAVESIIGRVLWPVFIIIVIGNVARTGLIVSLSMVLSLLAFYFIGGLTDALDKIKLLKIGVFLYFLAWIGRIFANSPIRILLVDSYANLSKKAIIIPWSAHSYDLALRSDYFEFIVLREIIYNLSRVIVMPFIILIFQLKFFPFLLSFLIAGIFSIFYVFIDP